MYRLLANRLGVIVASPALNPRSMLTPIYTYITATRVYFYHMYYPCTRIYNSSTSPCGRGAGIFVYDYTTYIYIGMYYRVSCTHPDFGFNFTSESRPRGESRAKHPFSIYILYFIHPPPGAYALQVNQYK